jgi:hypothetical protein
MSWQELIAGARMTVDQEFSSRVMESEFSRQQWGLVMTAVEFDIEDPDDAERARLVADTSKVEHVLPELDDIGGAKGPAGAGGAPRGGGGGGGGGGGILDSLKSLLGGGGGGGNDEEKMAAADALAQEYATELQAHLESSGRWDEVREAAADE